MRKRQREQSEKEAAQRAAAPVAPPPVPFAALDLSPISVPSIVETQSEGVVAGHITADRSKTVTNFGGSRRVECVC